MLSPDELNVVGDKVAAVYQQIEAEMIAELAHECAEGLRMSQRGFLDIVMLSQSSADKLRAIIDEHRDDVDKTILETAQRYLALSDVADMAMLKGEPKFPAKLKSTVESLEQWSQRLETEIPQSAQRLYIETVSKGATQVATGRKSADAAVIDAVREMSDEGISVIQYSTSGKRAYKMSVDAAVRTQVRNQMTHASQDMTMQRIRESGAGLVEVSSHIGARPSHAEWQGRVYSLNGPVTIDGVFYPDYNSSCHVGDPVDGIFGYNCRHSVGPYVHGAPRMYDPNPVHASGISNDEYYQLTQMQRARERGIRQAKRRVKSAQALCDVDATPENKAERESARQLLKDRQKAMRDFIDSANERALPGTQVLVREPAREWCG